MISLLQLHPERKSVFLVGHGDTDGVCSIEGGGWSATAEVVEENYADCSSHFPTDRMATAEGCKVICGRKEQEKLVHTPVFIT